MNIQGIYDQSLFDIVTRNYGSLNYLFQFLSVNPQVLTITEHAEGNPYTVNPNLTTNVKVFNKNASVFATYLQNHGRAFDFSFNNSWH